MREKEWKLITGIKMNPDESELFKISTDLGETHNVALENPELVHCMMETIVQERKLDGNSKRVDTDLV